MSHKHMSQKQSPLRNWLDSHNNSQQYLTTPSDCRPAFCTAMQAVYGPLDWLPVADGTIHRFRVPDDKPGSLNGWYILYLDGIASGAFGSWKTGGSNTWSSREPADHREAEQVRQRIEQARRLRESERLQRQQKAAQRAAYLWRNARPADPAHPYLVAKRVGPHDLRQRGDELLVPLRNVAGDLVNLQRIGADGSKRFLFGGQVQGAFHLLGQIDPSNTLFICEGFATGATLIEQYRGVYGVACAMNAGNLQPLALALRERFAEGLDLLIAGDDDRLTSGNPGRKAANATAVAAACFAVFPEWPANAPDHLTDFNDLQCWIASQENPHV